MQDAQALFKKHFSYTPTHVVRAPGRLEVLGNHTDYNDGLVMSVAVDKYVFVASSPRSDGRIEIVSSAFPDQREIFWLSEFKKNPAAPWADYVKGVLLQLRKRGVNFSGFSAAIHGTIPIGAGMSSSAALEVATALTVRRLYPFGLGETGATVPPKRNERDELPPLAAERLHLAKLCRAAENEFVGVPCGILDQISSLFGKAWSVMDIDCRALTVEHAPIAGEAIIVCESGVKHALVGGEYAELRRNCESAAAKLGAKSLRQVELKQLKAGKDRLTGREFECAHHVVSEIARVVAAGRALREDDHRQFGQYLFQSHESSRDFLKNSTPELDTLVELARKHPGCLGARLTGGGFGGATINLVSYHQTESFIHHMASEYEKKAGKKIKPVVCQVVDGAA